MRASSGLSIGGIGAWPASVAVLPLAKDCALPARAAALKYRQTERTWIPRCCATVLMFFSIVAGASVTPPVGQLREREGNSFLDRLRVPHSRIVGAPQWPAVSFTSTDAQQQAAQGALSVVAVIIPGMPISREYARSLFADLTQSAAVPLDPDELLHMPGLRQHGHVFFG
jgi:hypothetical protein